VYADVFASSGRRRRRRVADSDGKQRATSSTAAANDTDEANAHYAQLKQRVEAALNEARDHRANEQEKVRARDRLSCDRVP
jgi:hypothetical protein